MPMSTSDLRQPVCVELACLARHPAPRALPEATPNSLDSPGTTPNYVNLNNCKQHSRLPTNQIVSVFDLYLTSLIYFDLFYPVVYRCFNRMFSKMIL